MAVSQNKLLPVLGALSALIVGAILYQQFNDRPSEVKPADPMKTVPTPTKLPPPSQAQKKIPNVTTADGDNSSETLKTVVASNAELRKSINQVLDQNARLMDESKRTRNAVPTASIGNGADTSTASASTVSPSTANSSTAGEKITSSGSSGSGMLDAAGRAAEAFVDGFKGGKPKQQSTAPQDSGAGVASAGQDMTTPTGAISYKTVAPMGYAKQETRAQGNKQASTQYVRTMASTESNASIPADGTVQEAARAAKAKDEAYFTIPENATLVGATAMTSIIGRVPIDGRVTDPMQFKALIGRDNLAANGWELPNDLVGMIVTGVAIGDMALSCSEGKIRSLTFVFNDGTIRTVSSRVRSGSGGGGGGGGAGAGTDMGFISDEHGNPCIIGKFVTNAPRYLADIVGLKTLGVAGQAYATAQQQVTQTADGRSTSRILDTEKYVMGQAVSGATDEVTQWMLSRLKNSFDAVVTPSGGMLVIHMDQEVRLDKMAEARKIVHRTQATSIIRGARYGLE